MPDITTTVDIHIDLDKGLQSQPLRMMLAAGNAQAHQLRLHALRNGTPIDLSGTSVSGFCLRADGSTVPLEGKIENGAAVLLLSAACYAVPGTARISMTLIYGETIATHVLATAMVDAISSEIIVDPEHVIPSLTELLGQIAAMEQATDAAVGAAEFANASGEQAYLLAQQATVNLTTQVNERLRRIAPPIINTAAGDGVIVLTDSSENSFERLSIFGRTTQEGTPSPDNPAELVNIGTKGNIGLMVRGKNLLKNIATSGAWNGISFTVNEDGGVHLTGTATQLFSLVLTETGFIPAGKYLMLPARAGAANRAYVDVIAGGAQVVLAQAAETRPFTIKDGDNAYARIIVPEGETIDAMLYPVIYSASVTDLAFEPFMDGGSMTVIPPDEMHGIPVSSGGNYTDANGQQWICDEIDLARGVYIQRIRMAEAGSFSWTINPTWTESNPSATLAYARITGLKHGTCLSTSFVNRVFTTAPTYWNSGEMATQADGVLYAAIPKLDNPTNEGFAEYLSDRGVWILYQLAEPIETPLPDDIMAAAMALKSLYPNTTIINDEGAGMAAAYVADTKLYIDNKFAALAAASIDQ